MIISLYNSLENIKDLQGNIKIYHGNTRKNTE